MDPNAIVKHVPEMLKAGGKVVGALKLTDVVKAILGPATSEVAEMFREKVRLYRYKNSLQCIEKAERMAKDTGFTPKAVPVKLLFPLLEGASLEEDENLQGMWAALIANASAPDGDMRVRVGFSTILKDMSPDDAKLLRFFYSKGFTPLSKIGDPESYKSAYAGGFFVGTEEDLYQPCTKTLNIPNTYAHRVERVFPSIDNLARLRLIAIYPRRMVPERENGEIIMTNLGQIFVWACTAPKSPPPVSEASVLSEGTPRCASGSPCLRLGYSNTSLPLLARLPRTAHEESRYRNVRCQDGTSHKPRVH